MFACWVVCWLCVVLRVASDKTDDRSGASHGTALAFAAHERSNGSFARVNDAIGSAHAQDQRLIGQNVSCGLWTKNAIQLERFRLQRRPGGVEQFLNEQDVGFQVGFPWTN